MTRRFGLTALALVSACSAPVVPRVAPDAAPPGATRMPSAAETQRRLDELIERVDALERKVARVLDAGPGATP